MAIDLDPPESFLDQFREGAKWTTPDGTLTPQARHFLETLFRFNSGTWEKLGGPEDFISDGSAREFYPWKALKDGPETELTSIYSKPSKEDQSTGFTALFSKRIPVSEFEVIELKAGGTTHTTQGNEIVICNNMAPAIVTLNPKAGHKEQAIIVRNNAPISVTAVKKISGKTIKKILRRYTAPHHIFTTEADSWNVI